MRQAACPSLLGRVDRRHAAGLLFAGPVADVAATRGDTNGACRFMNAEIVTVGSELLLGQIVDTNTRMIAIALRENGFDLFRTATVGDNPERIALLSIYFAERFPLHLLH